MSKTVSDFVRDELNAPETLVGFAYMVSAIEYVNDTRETQFYKPLSVMFKKSVNSLERGLYHLKERSFVTPENSQKIFHCEAGRNLCTKEYVIRAASYYRRTYNEA